MKTVFIMQKSQVFTVNIEKIYSPKHYNLYLIINPELLEKVTAARQNIYFKNIFAVNDFSIETITSLIDHVMSHEIGTTLDIVTNSEWCVNLCGKLRTHYNLNAMDHMMAENFTNKLSMKDVLKTHNVRMPRYFFHDPRAYKNNKLDYVKHLIQQLHFPIFAKPINDANSNGTAKLDTMTALTHWLDSHVSAEGYELDEYIEGSLYHCDSFIKDEKILYTHVSEYTAPVFEFLQGTPLGSITLPLTHPDFIEIKKLNANIIHLLGYKGSGITHLEAFKNKGGEMIFLEIAARAGGAFLPKIYKKHLNIDLFESHFLLQLQKKFMPTFNQKGPYAACVWFPIEKGTVTKINAPHLKSHFETKLYTSVGETINRDPSLREKSGEIFLWNTNFKTLYEDFNYLKTFKLITTMR